ncbi:MAG: cytochrome c biogenesis protein [Anaerolineae bacterium]
MTQPSLPSHTSQSVARIVGILLVLMALFSSSPLTVSADGVVHFYYFFDPNCGSCEEVHKQVIEPLLDKYGARIVVEERNIGDKANFDLMLALEAHYQVAASSIPEVFIGDKALIGPEEITDNLEQQIEAYLKAGGVALPSKVTPGQTTATNTPNPGGASGNAAVKVLFFWSPTCPACQYTHSDVLPPIQQKYGDLLEVRAVNINSAPTQQFWYDTMAAFGIGEDAHYVPMLFIGSEMLLGAGAISETLPGLIDKYLAAGGVDYPLANRITDALAPILPGPTIADEVLGPLAPIYIAYFYQPGCDECERSEHDLAYILEKYPQVQVRRMNVKEDAALNQYLSTKAGVPESKQLTAPSLFIGDKYLLGDQVRAPAIEALLAPYLASGSPEPWIGFDASKVVVEQTVIDRFRSFGILTVVGAGLLDGVNPCAFATMIFLISYLTIRKRTGRALLATGGAFTLGVFLTYLGVGFGLLKFLEALPFLNAISKWIYAITALLCLGLAVGSLVDVFKARAGKLSEMSLKLPERLRSLSKKLIREGTGSKRFVLSALLLGFGVSIVELACTGQVYLPTIIFVLGVEAWRAQAALYLVLYNVMFILPLIGVFVLVYFGTTSQQLIDWMNKHTAAVKLGTAILFLLLAAWLSYSIITT